jgi:hypothetical protein
VNNCKTVVKTLKTVVKINCIMGLINNYRGRLKASGYPFDLDEHPFSGQNPQVCYTLYIMYWYQDTLLHSMLYNNDNQIIHRVL